MSSEIAWTPCRIINVDQSGEAVAEDISLAQLESVVGKMTGKLLMSQETFLDIADEYLYHSDTERVSRELRAWRALESSARDPHTIQTPGQTVGIADCFEFLPFAEQTEKAFLNVQAMRALLRDHPPYLFIPNFGVKLTELTQTVLDRHEQKYPKDIFQSLDEQAMISRAQSYGWEIEYKSDDTMVQFLYPYPEIVDQTMSQDAFFEDITNAIDEHDLSYTQLGTQNRPAERARPENASDIQASLSEANEYNRWLCIGFERPMSNKKIAVLHEATTRIIEAWKEHAD